MIDEIRCQDCWNKYQIKSTYWKLFGNPEKRVKIVCKCVKCGSERIMFIEKITISKRKKYKGFEKIDC